MNRCRKIIVIAVAVAVIINAFSVISLASMDEQFWDKSQIYTVIEEREKSNCAIDCAICKVLFDNSSNRIHLLFMLSLDSFADENLCGIQLDFNSLGKIKLMKNGENEYNDAVYFAELDTKADSVSKTLYLEVTVGIKQGIPQSLNMSVIFTDTQGVNSNTYKLDISPAEIPASSEDKADGKTKKSKTAVSKTTKTKKAKTSKSTKAESEKADNGLPSAEEVNVFDSPVYEDNSDKKTVIIAASAIGGAIIVSVFAFILKKRQKL